MRVLGRNIGIFLDLLDGRGPQVVGLSTNCTLDLQTEMVSVAGASAFNTSVVPGRNSMTIQVERLISPNMPLSLMQLQINRTPVDYVVEVENSTISGRAYISSQSAAGPSVGYATNSITLTCTGDITINNNYAALQL